MPDVFLIAPPEAGPDDLAAAIERLGATALLIPRADGDYAARVKLLTPVAQAQNVAVVIEGEPADVKKLGADGLHVTAGVEAVAAALKALKPQFIVGAGAIESRDEAMTLGESGVDYVFFGPISGSIDTAERELARWWAETMEVPSVLSDPEAKDASASAEGCEFLALGAAVWR